jgi:hypothetical protein
LQARVPRKVGCQGRSRFSGAFGTLDSPPFSEKKARQAIKATPCHFVARRRRNIVVHLTDSAIRWVTGPTGHRLKQIPDRNRSKSPTRFPEDPVSITCFKGTQHGLRCRFVSATCPQIGRTCCSPLDPAGTTCLATPSLPPEAKPRVVFLPGGSCRCVRIAFSKTDQDGRRRLTYAGLTVRPASSAPNRRLATMLPVRRFTSIWATAAP